MVLTDFVYRKGMAVVELKLAGRCRRDLRRRSSAAFALDAQEGTV
jgi:hypothetical protein